MRHTGQFQGSFEDMAIEFDRLFVDVDRLTTLEAQSLDTLFKPARVRTVLDCACGTGIQSLGLAQLGYAVCASDISPRMVQILREKAALRGLSVPAQRADFRNLRPWRGQIFDAVVCTGNSITLLKDHAEMARAVQAMVQRARPAGGLVVLGVHNYFRPQSLGETILLRRAPTAESPEVALDVRFFGSERVEVSYMFLRRPARRWHLRTYTKSYICLSAAELAGLLVDGGLRNVRLLDVTGERLFRDDDEWVLAVGER